MSPVSDTNNRAVAQRVANLAAEQARMLTETIVDRVLEDTDVHLDQNKRDDLRLALQGGLSVQDPHRSVREGLDQLRAARRVSDQKETPEEHVKRSGRGRGRDFRRSFNDHPNRRGPECEVLGYGVKNGLESPNLIVAGAVEAGALALDTYIVGHRMGILEARAQVTAAWLRGDVEACSDDVTELLYCFSKSGPRLTDEEIKRLWLGTVGFGNSTGIPESDINREFPFLFDELVQGFGALLVADDAEVQFDTAVAEAVLTNTIVRVAENLTAHVPDSVRVRAADLWLDVWEAYALLEEVADDICGGCIEGPWPVVIRYTNRRGLEHLWMVHEAVRAVLTRVVEFDVDVPGDALELDADLARAVGCLMAMAELDVASDHELQPAKAAANGGHALGRGRPKLAEARLG